MKKNNIKPQSLNDILNYIYPKIDNTSVVLETVVPKKINKLSSEQHIQQVQSLKDEILEEAKRRKFSDEKLNDLKKILLSKSGIGSLETLLIEIKN
jgi:hypothetical protein